MYLAYTLSKPQIQTLRDKLIERTGPRPAPCATEASWTLGLVLSIRSPFRVAVNGLEGPGEGVGDEGDQLV